MTAGWEYEPSAYTIERGLGLHDYNARHYAHPLGRWVAPDPIVPDPGDPQSLNRYSYVLNNPLKYGDPSGHAPNMACNGVMIADCGVDGWLGIEHYLVLKQLTNEWEKDARKVTTVAKTVANIALGFIEPIDYAMTIGGCLQGDCSVVGLGLMVLPFASGSIARTADDVVDIVKQIDPAELRWAQRTAGGNGRTAELTESLATRGWDGPPIDVVQIDEGLVTVDHTRAAIALELDITSIPARIHQPQDALPDNMLNRFVSPDGQIAKTWGEAIAFRAARQRPPLSSTGTTPPPRLPRR